MMKDLAVDSAEFQRIMLNLQLENMMLPPHLQQKVIELINANKEITSAMIKQALRYEQV
ncbi:MAG TPA: Zn-dependent hydrolase [Pseudogracilibacillus sp.]|nr:Zn-dependent hydrolase [Pseudogracilibacillus sp.]